MNEKSSRTVPVVVGFGVCLFLILVVGAVAYFGNSMHRQMLSRINEQNEARAQTALSLREFGAARLAMAGFRETDDPDFEKIIIEHIDRSQKLLGDAKSRLIAAEQYERADRLMKSYDAFNVLCRREIELARHWQERAKESVKTQQDVLTALDELEALRKKTADDLRARNAEQLAGQNEYQDEISKTRESVFRIAGLQREFSLFSTDIADAAHKKIMEAFTQSQASLQEIRNRAVTDAMKESAMKTMNRFAVWGGTIDETAKLYAERQAMRQERDRGEAETEMFADQISELQAASANEHEHEAIAINRHTAGILTLVVFVSTIIGIVTGFVVVRMVNRETAIRDDDGFSSSPSAPFDDWRVVADKLQEVVDLLRK